MPAYITPLDPNYISLKRAAVLIAREQAGVDPHEVMEMFKPAINAREFARDETAIHGMASVDDGDRHG
jgi:hypothetical protein